MERGPLKRIQAQVGLAHLLLELSFEEANAGTRFHASSMWRRAFGTSFDMSSASNSGTVVAEFVLRLAQEE